MIFESGSRSIAKRQSNPIEKHRVQFDVGEFPSNYGGPNLDQVETIDGVETHKILLSEERVGNWKNLTDQIVEAMQLRVGLYGAWAKWKEEELDTRIRKIVETELEKLNSVTGVLRDEAMLTSKAGFTRKNFIATVAAATGVAFLGKFAFNYLEYKKNPTNIPGSASDKIASGSAEWQKMQNYIEQAVQDTSLSSNPLYLKSIKAFQRAAQDHLYANRPGVPASAVAIINQGRYSHSAVRINVSLIEKLLTKSVTQPVYKLLGWAVLLKEGRTVLDQEARPDFYVRLAMLKSKLNGLSDDELEEFMARLVTAEAVGYAQMGRFLKDGIGEDVVSEIRQLYNQENDPIIKSLLGSFIDPVYAANIKASGLPAEQQKVIKELFLKTMILSKVQLNSPVRKQFDAHMAGNFQVDMTRIYDLQFATNPQLLSKMIFLLKPEYLLPKDEAMVTNMPINGGIDLDRSKMQMNINKQEEGVQMHFDPVMIQKIKRDGFDGIEFKIETIVPIANLPLLLGLQESEQNKELAAI